MPIEARTSKKIAVLTFKTVSTRYRRAIWLKWSQLKHQKGNLDRDLISDMFPASELFLKPSIRQSAPCRCGTVCRRYSLILRFYAQHSSLYVEHIFKQSIIPLLIVLLIRIFMQFDVIVTTTHRTCYELCIIIIIINWKPFSVAINLRSFERLICNILFNLPLRYQHI